MLSSEAIDFLEELSRLSHSAYPEGGFLYTYMEAANQAHLRFQISNAEQDISLSKLHELACFLQSSQGEYTITQAKPAFLFLGKKLMSLLARDLEFSHAGLSLTDGGDSMDLKLVFIRQVDNRFFSLELFWSID